VAVPTVAVTLVPATIATLAGAGGLEDSLQAARVERTEAVRAVRLAEWDRTRTRGGVAGAAMRCMKLL
jgi:hypothetical protein